MEFFLRLRGGKISSGRGQLHFLIVMMTQMKSRREEIATIARQDNERLGLITFVNTLVEIVVISPFHEAKIVK